MQRLTAIVSPLSLILPLTLAWVAAVVSAQEARPVDTAQFGLLERGMSQAEVVRRLGPPAHVKTDTQTILVPIHDRFEKHRRKHAAPPYVVRTIEYEWWYYPEGGGSMATMLEFRDGELYAKDKYR